MRHAQAPALWRAEAALARWHRRVPARPTPLPGGQPLLGLVDTGGALLHPEFIGPAGPRVVALWDQADRQALWPWQSPPLGLRGRELLAADLRAFIRQSGRPGASLANYRQLAFPPNGTNPDHATQVLDALAGPRLNDAAARATLALVSLPPSLGRRPAGPEVLDALAYLLACGTGPVLVALAIGSSWGARALHPPSPFERALDALLLREPRLMVVWAGGCAARLQACGLNTRFRAAHPIALTWLPEPRAHQQLGLWSAGAPAPEWRIQAPDSALPSAWQVAKEGLWPLRPGALVACRRLGGRWEWVLELGPGADVSQPWRFELRAKAGAPLQCWLSRTPQIGWLRCSEAADGAPLLWNAMASGRWPARVMEPGADVPADTLALALPAQGLAVLEGCSGALVRATGSSTAAALACRELFNRLSAQPATPPSRAMWSRLWAGLQA